jgi:2,3-dihydroxyphenylpropionate 1,2-dioxygenase
MSHTPLLQHADPPAHVMAAVTAAFDQARHFVRSFAPDLIVNIGPDHYNGFFYDLMPPYCVGYRAHGVGDYGSYAGTLDVPDLVEDMAEFVIGRGIDLAVSRDMRIDHGAVQPLEILLDPDPAALPVIPVFVNSVAKPLVSMARVRQLGEAIGQFFRGRAERVLFIGSGGLSHDPPVPRYATATDPQRDFLIHGRNPTPEARAAREQRTIETARRFAAGTADIMELNPEWDRDFLAVCRAGRVEAFDEYDTEDMEAVAGHSAHEIRTWVTAYSALRECGDYQVTYEFYRPIKEFIAGFAVTTAVVD